MSSILSLPNDVLSYSMCFLSPKETANCFSANRIFQRAVIPELLSSHFPLYQVQEGDLYEQYRRQKMLHGPHLSGIHEMGIRECNDGLEVLFTNQGGILCFFMRKQGCLTLWNLLGGGIREHSIIGCGKIKWVGAIARDTCVLFLFENGQVYIKKISDGKKDGEFFVREPLAVQFDKRRNILIVGGKDGSLETWSLETGQRLCTAESRMICFLEMTGDGQLVSGHKDGVLRLWDLERLRVVDELRAEGIGISPILVACGGVKLLLALGRILKCWDLKTQKDLQLMEKGECKDVISHLRVNQEGTRGIVAFMDGNLNVFDLTNGSFLKRLREHKDPFSDIQINGQGTRAISCSKGGKGILWDLVSGGSIGLGTGISRVCFSLDGSRVFLGSTLGAVDSYRLDGLPIERIQGALEGQMGCLVEKLPSFVQGTLASYGETLSQSQRLENYVTKLWPL